MKPSRGEDLLLGVLTQLCSSGKRKAIRLGVNPFFQTTDLFSVYKSRIMHHSLHSTLQLLCFQHIRRGSTLIERICDLKFAAVLTSISFIQPTLCVCVCVCVCRW